MTHLLLIIIYVSFISLGLPDSLLGSAWPTMFTEFNVPVSFAGIVSMIIALGTIISSLASDFLNKKFGTGLVTTISVGMTALALLLFSFCNNFWLLCLFAIPYGLGAGGVDAALNNYVALNYSGKHMSWLHCMWGVGTIIGPSIMGALLTAGKSWNAGYGAVSLIQIVLTVILVVSLPLWKKVQKEPLLDSEKDEAKENKKAKSFCSILKTPGALAIMITFFCYCALEQTTMLWASSYFVLHDGVSEELSATLAGLFFIGITLGRFINGFATIKLSDKTLILIGQAIITVGIIVLAVPFGKVSTLIGIVLIGLGCAPIYPCIIHSTPYRFGKENSGALIGVQMASAYIGTCFAPPLFGLIANHLSISLLPLYLAVLIVLMATSYQILLKKTAQNVPSEK